MNRENNCQLPEHTWTGPWERIILLSIENGRQSDYARLKNTRATTHDLSKQGFMLLLL